MNRNFTSVIIINYKTKELTRDCINSVIAQVPPSGYEIIVVDNASNDGSVEYLRKHFPDIDIIANEVNVGFGKANNIGVCKALGKYIFLLNPDTIVTGDILSTFIRFYDEHSYLKIGVIGSLLISENFEVLHSFGSNFPFFMKLLLNDRRFKNKQYLLKQIESDYFTEVDIVVGADMFMERSVFNEFLGFDTNIFLYEEELELQYRMRKGNYSSIILNEKKIIHLEGRASASYFKRKCSFISLCYVLKKHLPAPLYYLCRMQLTLYAVIFFKNPKTSWNEKVNYFKLSIFGQ